MKQTFARALNDNDVCARCFKFSSNRGWVTVGSLPVVPSGLYAAGVARRRLVLHRAVKSLLALAGAEIRLMRTLDGQVFGFEMKRRGQNVMRGNVIQCTVQNQPIYFFVTDEDDLIQREHVRGLFYEPEELEIIAKHFKGGTFVDIGAHVGNHSIFAAKFFGASKVIAFEPNPAAYLILKCNIALNGLESRIVHHAVGLSDQPGRADFITPRNNLGATRLSHCAEGAFTLARADDVLANDQVDFIKIDVERMEMKVLAGLSGTIARNRPPLFVEVESKSFPAFADFAKAKNYQFADEFSRYSGVINFLLLPK